MKKITIVVKVMLGMAGILILMSLISYNDVVEQQENVKEKWEKVKSVYQRRADLIPDLVSTVKGAANFESSALTEIAEAKTQPRQIKISENTFPPNFKKKEEVDVYSFNNPEAQEAYLKNQDRLSSSLKRLMTQTENYPELRAARDFRYLQIELEGIENHIVIERERYNEVVKSYNTAIRKLPACLFAGLLGFEKIPLTFPQEGYVKKLTESKEAGKTTAAIYHHPLSSKTIKDGWGSGNKSEPISYYDYDPKEVNAVATGTQGMGLPEKNKVYLSKKAKEDFSEGFVQLWDELGNKIVISSEEDGLKTLSSIKTIDGTFGLQLEGVDNFSLTMGGVEVGRGVKVEDEEKFSALTAKKLSLESLRFAKEKLDNPKLSKSERELLALLYRQAIRQMDYAVEKHSEKALVIKNILVTKERPLTKNEAEYYEAMREINYLYRNYLIGYRRLSVQSAERIAPTLELQTLE
jgi:LemA protein